MKPTPHASNLPDAQKQTGQFSALDWVGMEAIAMPVSTAEQRTPALLDLLVNLAPDQSRGIHMSRLYLLAEKHLQSGQLSVSSLLALLAACVDSQSGLSNSARLKLKFNLLLKRDALVSANSGWRIYPALVEAHLSQSAQGWQSSLRIGVEILYSSTCPSSAALARQVLAQHAENAPQDPAQISAWLRSAENGSVATAHAQRSRLRAQIQLALDGENSQPLPWLQLISDLEAALQTPVQTAVKREDELAFAQRNGSNLMFVEDALRRARGALERFPNAAGFYAHAVHWESLHAHNASGVVKSADW